MDIWKLQISDLVKSWRIELGPSVERRSIWVRELENFKFIIIFNIFILHYSTWNNSKSWTQPRRRFLGTRHFNLWDVGWQAAFLRQRCLWNLRENSWRKHWLAEKVRLCRKRSHQEIAGTRSNATTRLHEERRERYQKPPMVQSTWN